VKVRDVDFGKWNSSGIIHTKLMLVDRKHFYLGSANFDWRALTQVRQSWDYRMTYDLVVHC